jgi:hypothetical protein
MTDISDLMRKHNLRGLGIAPTMNIAWSAYASERGSVSLIPQGVGVFSGSTLDEAVSKVAQFDLAMIEGGC